MSGVQPSRRLTGEPAGTEALAAGTTDPRRLAPDTFLPLAESAGLIRH